ncbi:TonB-dependent receptor [Marinilongibacter aquaticus]|uniref:TonB-dependent receptor domain-containing protein n=1 Tax=Marinilongibacter aquaticus TaxID=2975157 RepID=UPI0021BCFC40|nr:TonB-dependent receptor [Marinilongibacter aquaticus]UBM60555.1 TonB-dependent receptor [Marinilongibacter aquaticus]
MKRISIVLLLLVLSFGTQAQFGRPSGGGSENGRPQRSSSQGPGALQAIEDNAPKGNAKITGYVIDSAMTSAIEYANIAMRNEENNKVVDGTMADEKGKFTFNKIAPGTYSFTITFIGYNDRKVEHVKIKKGDDIDLGAIKLGISSQILNEVTVTGLKSVIEEKVDRLVYNAENDISAKGGDGADILRKVPMLSVDLDGNVSLRGSSNVRVLINNKPSTIVASSVADALKMIPADLIKTVEVITSPSAKYDAEGTSGIINIITKKSSIEGYNFSINAGTGVRGSNLGLNGNLRAGKFGFTLGGFGRSFYNKAQTILDQQTTSANGTQSTKQVADAKDNGLFGRYNLGIDYEISKNEYINANVSFGVRNFKRNQDMTIDQFVNLNDATEESTFSSNRYIRTKDLSNNVDLNLDYVKIFKPSHEFSISSQYSQNNLTNNFDSELKADEEHAGSFQRNINGNVNKEITIQSDYMLPIGKNQLFETGVKGIFRIVDSDYRYLLGLNAGNLEADASKPSGLLNYNQNIGAGYLQYTFSTASKITFKAGLRYEHTSIDAEDKVSKLDIPAYQNLIPSVNIAKTFSGGTTIKLAYNNRLQRPGLQQLNPNYNASNPQSITIGNPSLKPEISNNVELSFSKTFKRNYFNISFFGRQTNNSISRLSTASDTLIGAIITEYKNVGTQKTAGANLFGNVYITPKWSLNGGFDMYYNYLEGQVRTLDGYAFTHNSGVTVSGRLMTMLSLKNDWAIQGFSGFRGRNVSLQGYNGGMAFYNLGLQKSFNEKKGSVGIAFENFVNGMRMKSNSVSEVFVQNSLNKIYNQNVKVTFSYKLGNMKFVEKRKTRSVNNTDVKSSGSGNGGYEK